MVPSQAESPRMLWKLFCSRIPLRASVTVPTLSLLRPPAPKQSLQRRAVCNFWRWTWQGGTGLPVPAPCAYICTPVTVCACPLCLPPYLPPMPARCACPLCSLSIRLNLATFTSQGLHPSWHAVSLRDKQKLCYFHPQLSHACDQRCHETRIICKYLLLN